MSQQNEALRRIQQAKRSNISELGINDLNLTTIPDSLGELSNLEVLNASNNQIRAIPEFVSNLKNLRFLYLSTNQISAIPDSLAKLSNLRQLTGLSFSTHQSADPQSQPQSDHRHSELPCPTFQADATFLAR
jgi:Leucine-rich repeat (LRR) protein